MKKCILITLSIVGILLSACHSSTCPEGAVGYLSPPYPPPVERTSQDTTTISLNKQEIVVDEVISGPICNDSWSGTVYVTCDIQIPAYDLEEEEALFFQDCDLEIEEGTVVYTEAHGNAPYYQGCSCHE
jgi:hypothetical protein